MIILKSCKNLVTLGSNACLRTRCRQECMARCRLVSSKLKERPTLATARVNVNWPGFV